jgi:exopolysaccharide production protein ExoZ
VVSPTLQQQSRRIVSIQVCRGLAALLVVFTHIQGIETKYFAVNHLRLFAYGDLGVDLFFVISGVVIASVTAGKFGRPRDACIFLYHRLARIFPVFWIYTTLTLFAYLIPLQTAAGRFNIVASYLLIPTHLPMLLLQGWTLSFELYFYLLIFLLLLLVPERFVPWLLTLWGVTVIVLKLHIGLSPSPIVQLLIGPSVCEFLAGWILFRIYRRSRLHPAAGVLLIAASFAFLMAVTFHNDPSSITDHPWRRPLLYGSFATLFLFGAMELERTRLIRYLPFFASIGDWSYSIYLSHVLVLNLIARLIAPSLPYPAAMALLLVVGIAAVLLIGYLSYTFIERPLLTLLYKPAPSPQTPAKQPA